MVFEKAIKVLEGCAPCQPFSSYSHSKKDKAPNKYDLLNEFGRLVKEVQPDIVTMENVVPINKKKSLNSFLIAIFVIKLGMLF